MWTGNKGKRNVTKKQFQKNKQKDLTNRKRYVILSM